MAPRVDRAGGSEGSIGCGFERGLVRLFGVRLGLRLGGVLGDRRVEDEDGRRSLSILVHERRGCNQVNVRRRQRKH